MTGIVFEQLNLRFQQMQHIFTMQRRLFHLLVISLFSHSSLGISLNDGQSELLLVRDIKNLIDFNNVSTALLKSDFRENENIVSKKVRRVKFLFDSPVDWTLDGEYGGTVKEVEIVNHQRAVNMIVPR